jgi:hypothetical protein
MASNSLKATGREIVAASPTITAGITTAIGIFIGRAMITTADATGRRMRRGFTSSYFQGLEVGIR